MRKLMLAPDILLAALLGFSLASMAVLGPYQTLSEEYFSFWRAVPVALVWLAMMLGMMFFMRRFQYSAFGRFFRCPASVLLFFAALFAAQAFLGWCLHSSSSWDPQALLSGADKLLRREPYTESYFYMYPNNRFLLSFYRYLFTALNMMGRTEYFYAAVLCDIAAVDVALLFLFGAARRLWGMHAAWTALLMGVPIAGLSPWIAVPYSDTFGIPFPVGCVYCAVCMHTAKTRRARLLAVAGFAFLLLVGARIKPTVFVVGVAAAIWEALRWLRGREAWRDVLSAAVCFTVSAAVAFGAAQAFQQKATGEVFDPAMLEEKRFGIAHYFMMGLGQPVGGFNQDDVDFTSGIAGANEKTRANLAMARHRLEKMGAGGYLAFLGRKLNFSWNDGSFFLGREGDFYVQFAAPDTPVTDAVRSVASTVGTHYGILAVWQQGQWVLCLALVLAGLFAARRVPHAELLWMSRLCMLGLMLFLLLFEARSRYVYHFLPVICLAALGGLLSIFELLGAGLHTWKKEN